MDPGQDRRPHRTSALLDPVIELPNITTPDRLGLAINSMARGTRLMSYVLAFLSLLSLSLAACQPALHDQIQDT